MLTASFDLPQALQRNEAGAFSIFILEAEAGMEQIGQARVILREASKTSQLQGTLLGTGVPWMKTLVWQGDKPLLLVFPLFLKHVQKQGLIYQLLPLFAAFSTRCKVGIGNNWGRNCCDGKEELPPSKSMPSFLKWHSGEIHPDHPWKTPAADSKNSWSNTNTKTTHVHITGRSVDVVLPRLWNCEKRVSGEASL